MQSDKPWVDRASISSDNLSKNSIIVAFYCFMSNCIACKSISSDSTCERNIIFKFCVD